MKNITVKWRDGTRGIKVNAEVAAKALQKIRTKKKGQFQPIDVVNEARRKTHPLHSEFEWNDEKAAEAHRIERARYLIRSLEIRIVKETEGGPKSVTIRQFTSIGTGIEDGPNSRFRDTREVISDAEMRSALIRKIWNQLLNLKRQYEDVFEFTAIWKAIEETERNFGDVAG